jgi:hypothetical protein
MTQRPAPHVIRWFLRTFGYGGITLPPWGVFILAERINETALVRHEQAHWAQYQRMGMLGFYVTYIWYTMRHGYWNNPLEVEAREHERLHRA